MSVIRCPQGHYYDDQRFSRCPHCGISSVSGGQEGSGSAGKEGQEGKTRSLLGWLDREKTVAFGHRKAARSGAASGLAEDARSMAASGTAEGRRSAAGSGSAEGHRSVAAPGSAEAARNAATPGGSEDARTVAMSGMPDGDHTIALAAAPMREDDQRTVSFYSGAKGNDYVTGWLVCVEGPEKGRDYRLHHGFNRIGRDMEMDVQVTDDPAVSRKNHCSIVYDEKSRSFSVVPSPGSLTYYKGQLLEKATRMEAGDEIRMGESGFVFIPFCGEGRTWEEFAEG